MTKPSCFRFDNRRRSIGQRDGAPVILYCYQGMDNLAEPFASGRFTDQHITGIQTLLIDIDPPDGQTVDYSITQLRGACHRLGLPEPTRHLATGTGGWHPHWDLDKPMAKTEGLQLWREFTGLLLTAMGSQDVATKIRECKATTLWPAEGLPSRKNPKVAARIIGGTNRAIDTVELVESLGELMEGAAPELCEMVRPPLRRERTPSSTEFRGPHPLEIEQALEAIGKLPPKQKDDGTWDLWRRRATSATAGDIEHGGGNDVLRQAVVNACGHRDAEQKLPLVEPRGLGFGTLKLELQEAGLWPGVGTRRVIEPERQPDAAQGATGGNESDPDSDQDQPDDSGPTHKYLHQAYVPRPRHMRTWVWDGLIPAGEVTLMTGPGGCGKTSAVMKLIAAIAAKAADLGGAALDPGADPVVLVTVGEQSQAQLQELALLATAGEQNEDGDFVPYFHQVDDDALGKGDFWESLKQARELWPTSVFVLDSASSCLRVQSDNSDSVREGYGRLRAIGGTWLVLHHNNKDREVSARSVDKVRGSTAWVDGCDRLIMAEREEFAVRLNASRRGDERQVVLDVPWQKTPVEAEEPKKKTGRPSVERDECEDWMRENRDYVMDNKVTRLKDMYQRFVDEGGKAKYRTFGEARLQGRWLDED